MCFCNNIYSLATFSRVVPLCKPNTTITAKYKIVCLSLELHQRNWKGNRISFSMDMGDGSFLIFHLNVIWQWHPQFNVIFKYCAILCNTNTLQLCSKLFYCPWNSIQETIKTTMYYHNIWILMMGVSSNILFKGVLLAMEYIV